MIIKELLKEKNMSVYRLAKESGIPYTTVNDICSGRAQLEKCSAETVYKIADTLNVSMEELLEPYLLPRSSFENFKSSVCHQGDILPPPTLTLRGGGFPVKNTCVFR